MEAENNVLPNAQNTLVVLLGASAWPEWPNLDSPNFERSYDELRKYFLDPQGFNLPIDNLLDLFNSQELSGDLANKISNWFSEKLSNKEKCFKDLVLYFAGHADFSDFSGDSRSYYLVTGRARKNDLETTAYAAFAFAKLIKSVAPKLRRYLIFDCCFSAAMLELFKSDSFEKDLTTDAPTKGTAIFCSSSTMGKSYLGKDKTMLAEALLHVLRASALNRNPFLSLQEIITPVINYLETTYREEAARPELHNPDQDQGPISFIPVFPNPINSCANSTRIFVPEDRVQCCVILSEAGKAGSGHTIIRQIVTNTLTASRKKIQDAAGKPLADKPFLIEVENAISSKHMYGNTLEALCKAELLVVDITHYEPAVMLLLGIRSVVRRGVTVSVNLSDNDFEDQMSLPFNINQIKLARFGTTSTPDNNIVDWLPQATHMLGEMLVNGLKQLSNFPNYLDLPTFDAVRKTPPRGINQDNRRNPNTDQILFLCSFSKKYQQNNWKRFLLQYLANAVEGRTAKKPIIARSLDLFSPRLVSQILFEEIRFTSMCIVDWTEWKPNVFFELGVRLAVTLIPPVCIIESSNKELIKTMAKVNKVPTASKMSAKEFEWMRGCIKQYLNLLELFQPIEYICDDESMSKSCEEICDTYDGFFREGSTQPNKLAIQTDFTYQTLCVALDINVEVSAIPVYQELLSTVDQLSDPTTTSSGESPVLYPSNPYLRARAQSAAIERLLAAWFYLQNRYTLEELATEEQLTKYCKAIGFRLIDALLPTNNPNDKKLAGEIRERVTEVNSLTGGI